MLESFESFSSAVSVTSNLLMSARHTSILPTVPEHDSGYKDIFINNSKSYYIYHIHFVLFSCLILIQLFCPLSTLFIYFSHYFFPATYLEPLPRGHGLRVSPQGQRVGHGEGRCCLGQGSPHGPAGVGGSHRFPVNDTLIRPRGC